MRSLAALAVLLTFPAAAAAARPEPLAARQWDMRVLHATARGSYAHERADHRVRVAVLDTGVDARHPDIAPNYSAALSRDFTGDGPPGVDKVGHGTHVAGTIAGALNGFGTAGVAPGAEIVSLRVGDDDGRFLLGPTVEALRYAADHGIDVVNMSFFLDPWLFNCPANPADSPAEQQEQATILDTMQRAIADARARGVTLVAALGNENTDLGAPSSDDSSPNFPPGRAHDRQVDNSCRDLPAEGDGVIGVSSTGRSGRKAFYSDYGLEQNDLAAPGGDRLDTPPAQILGPVPNSLARHGDRDLVRSCRRGRCAWYGYLEGTSMAAPHVAGVAALIVARYGRRDRARGGLTLAPDRVQEILGRTAAKRPCPTPNPFTYPGLGDEFTAACEGTPERNGFYGSGVVDALAAVRAVRR